MKEFKLNNSPKIESGFKIPDNDYFENFSVNISQQLPKDKPKVISLFQKNKRIFMIAAAVLVIALMIPILNTVSKNSKELDETTLENYLSYQSNMNQYDLINVLDLEDINNINTTIALEDQTIEDILINNNNLENFIIEQ
jgi:hypothetical protein